MVSSFISTVTVASLAIVQHSNALPADSYLIDSDIECYNDYGYEGRFHFLDNKAEAFWHLESDNIYFEFYFPAARWIGIAAANQYTNDEYNYCVDCYQENQDMTHCLASCVANNVFVATAKGDNDPKLAWNILEFQVHNNGKNVFNQYQMKDLLSIWGVVGRNNASFFLEKVELEGMEYIHGSWRRELDLDHNQWMQPINDFDDICWTTIASIEDNPNARASEFGYFADKDSVEIHCNVAQKKICHAELQQKEDHIPDFGIEIADDVCEDKNLSLVILMDSSMSIADYFDVSKSWISNLLQHTAELFDHENDKRSIEEAHAEFALCLRSALILFDHEPQLIWNLDYFDASYNHAKAKSMLTQAIAHNQLKRMSGTHIKDVLQYTVDHVFPLMHVADTNIVLMLSDGKPSSCYHSIDQNPCIMAPNSISKAFEETQVKFLVVAVGDEDTDDKHESFARMSSVFECLYPDMETMQDSIIISPSFMDLDQITQSVESHHICGFDPQYYHCDVQLYDDGAISLYSNDWNYASYTFTVGHNDDIWPYSASIKVQSECVNKVELHAKLMHFDPISQHTTLIKKADQIWTLSSNDIPQDSEYKFSFRGSSIDRKTGRTLLHKLEVAETYVIQFYVVDKDARCRGRNMLPVVAVTHENEYYELDKYFMDISSSVAWIKDDDSHISPSQNVRPLITLCIAERVEHIAVNEEESDYKQVPQTLETTHDIHTTQEPKAEVADISTTRQPTTKPTLWPTREYQEDNLHHCQAPKYFPSPLDWNQCEAESAEWKVDFKNWFYNVYEDKTYVEYEVCVLAVPPFRACPLLKQQTSAMSMIMFQIPCFCEVCLNSMTDYMKPKHGYTTEVHQGWIWEYLVFPAECQQFEMALDGYVPMDTGYYKVMGDNRWIEGAIQVPNPCEPAIGYPMNYEKKEEEVVKHEDEDEDDASEICYHETPMYPDHDCSYVCDSYMDNEWRMDYISRYNEDGNTVFVYNALVESNVNALECTKKEHNTAQALSKIYLRLGCDCEYQSASFLESMTVKMEPFGEIKDNFWEWTLDLKEGEIKELKLILKGENMEMSYSDMTLAGSDRRCTSSNMIQVPNPCRNECNYGEWSKWSTFGECSEECGGGYKYKTRECVSICDGVTPTDNCVGQNNHISPCNTNPCHVSEESN